LGPEVLPVKLDQSVADNSAEPQEWRDLRVADVLVQTTGGVKVGLLEDVGRVDTAL